MDVSSQGAGVAAALLLQAGLGDAPIERWVVIGAIALVAIYLLRAGVRCALRLVGLALLLVGAVLAWRWLT